MIRWTYLDGIAEQKRAEWARDQPIPFITIDGMMEDGMCEALADFSSIDAKLNNPLAKSHKHVRGKSGTPSRERMTALQRLYFDEVNSERFIRFVERVTGIEPIHADARLNGGGLHQIKTGGYLNVHTDFNFNPETRLNRRLNLLLYLNQDWDPAWNGDIELWDEKLDRPFFSAAPVANRVLLFETSETSYHGHPVPLATPAGITRKSLAVYYYSTWPEGLGYRNDTGYQLTRLQWAKLIGRIGELVAGAATDEDAIVAALELDWMTGDIRRAYRTLMDLRSTKTVREEYWEMPDGSLSLAKPQ